MPDDPNSQLSELKTKLAADKHCLAAAEMDLYELHQHKKRVEERICHAELAVKELTATVDDSWRAVRRRIDAETDSPLDNEMIAERCRKLLSPVHNV